VPDDEQIRIKDYQIHFPPLGEGAFGRVYRATYRGISERALKIFRSGAVDLSSMARELEKLSLVAEHQGIVTLHDFDLLNEPPYYAMGLHAQLGFDGSWETRTLERLCGHIDHREGWRLIREIADALAYLHRHQIVHCDIKPSNILLTDETPLHTKICDFGQSRGLATEGFDPVGTPLYASPEQLRHPRDSGQGKGFRWDVYSFGVVSFKLLTGELPRLQGLSEAEGRSLDLESTLDEASLEATLAETGNPVDGDQLATLTEAVEEITWPSDVYVPSSRKELIEACLSLAPGDRPADMREVYSRIQQIDQQNVVRRARRLNTIFATLLVFAIWASGFAFIQAQKAKRATETQMLASAESEKSASAAMDLMLLFVSELNKGDISGSGAERLYTIVAENSAPFLENRSKDRPNSTRILRFSAQTASLRARQSLAKGRLEDALKDFTSAYEIRSKLADDPDAPVDLPLLTSRDLMEIGKIQELLGDYSKASQAYSEALEWRSQTAPEEELFSLSQLKDLSATYLALARTYSLRKDSKSALATLSEILTILNRRIEDGKPADVPGYTVEAVRVLDRKGLIEYEEESLSAATKTYEELIELAKSLESAPPTIAEEARQSYLGAVSALGRVQLAQKQPEAALVLFREEIKLREAASQTRPYNAVEKIALADAYAQAAQCLDTETSTARSLARFYLEKAVELIDQLPSEVRTQMEIQKRLASYRAGLADLQLLGI
jgi:serine/threonine protein kinase